ncbi:D-alanyl-D-alanine carboxypeptidase family protein [uncultured Clostridium sp.]|uniref:D-alanyl-D-alanine carboxypeptidase family protein n=1 Tax=uncultured Clostridium sp. TaxID=59620 RepID=UPI0028EDD309|nr:D-alanyl-D-alanine carboxypeptidase family protein [uncultured Clostridium sp.]
MKIKFKKILSLLSLFTFLTVQGAYLPSEVKAEGEGINVEASSAILIEPTSGKIIYEKNPHEKLAPASVTKIMTMLIAMEAVDSGKIKLTDKITVSEEAKNKGKNGNSSMLLDTGEIRTVEEILKGIAIASGNDAATAMAEYIAGSEEAFVKMMNDRAQELGMKNTTFKNPSGLSAPGHLTTAHDIALMSVELIKHPKILKYTGTYMETISEGRKSPIGLVNHNKLVRFFKGCDGLKTGFTNEAMYCISATAVRDEVRMLTVIMGAPTYKVRNRDASMLMNYGFSKFESIKVLTKDDNVEKVQLGKNEENYFIAKASENFNYIVEKGSKDKVTKKCVVNLDKKHYNKGEVVGVCEIYSNEKLIGKVKIYCDRDIKKAGFLDNLKFNFKNLFNNAV